MNHYDPKAKKTIVNFCVDGFEEYGWMQLILPHLIYPDVDLNDKRWLDQIARHCAGLVEREAEYEVTWPITLHLVTDMGAPIATFLVARFLEPRYEALEQVERADREWVRKLVDLVVRSS